MSSISTSSTSSSSVKRKLPESTSTSASTSSTSTTALTNSQTTYFSYFQDGLENVSCQSLVCAFLEPHEAEKISARDPELRKALFPIENNSQNEGDNRNELVSKKQKLKTVFRKRLDNEYDMYATLTEEKMHQIFELPSGYKPSLSLFNNGILFVEIQTDNFIFTQLWNITNPKFPRKIFTPFMVRVCNFRHHSDNIFEYKVIPTDYNGKSNFYADNSIDGLCDLTDDRFKEIAVFRKCPYEMFSATPCKISKNLLAMATGNQINLYDITDPSLPNKITSFLPDQKYIWFLRTISDNIIASRQIASSTTKLWDITTLTKPICIATLAEYTAYGPHFTKISEKVIASNSENNTIKLWDIADPTKPICITTLEGHTSMIADITRISDNIIASTSSNGICKLWDISNLENPLIKSFGSQDFHVTKISKITEGTIAIYSSQSKEITYWNIGKYIHNSEHPFIKGMDPVVKPRDDN